ncbi:solute carrier family 40 member 2 isoform X1 [Eucalyptus grandis]|uniref:solute carrier family 40 member 2 isoform X1 n=2 Tax=Eucalyptus grandis TaxID=71139 RepID=UPI00192EFC7F|nr:solute carrier family 40 member 2 isoform X1 [Eucalyptus grandis]
MERSGSDQDRAIQPSNTIASTIAQSSASGGTESGVETGGDGGIRKFDLVDQQDPEREMVGSQERVAPPPRLLIRYLYIGHFLARWGARMWEFSVALYFISLWPSSFLFAAIYGTVESASTALFGAVVGKWMDTSTYTKVLRIWLLTQNFSFFIAGGTVLELLFHSNLKSTNFVAFISLVILICFSGAIGVLSALAGSIMIEREWVVVISEGHPPETLTQMNSVVRRIDLICKLFAPVVSGFFISFASLKASAVAFALWNFASVWLQYWLMSSVYSGIPALRENNRRRRQKIPLDGTEGRVATLEGGALHDEASVHGTEENSLMRRKMNLVMNSAFMVSWRTYLRQEVVLPGIALALLYFTVLSFGTLMMADLKWEGIPAYIIGIGRGISATIGIAATLIYPFLHSRISTLRTGLWSIWCQWTFLIMCIASIWVQNKHLSVSMLMGGVATSRLGLWMFDLSVTQLMQDNVPECDRGAVGGVQNSLQSALDLMSSVMGIIISDPRDFWKLSLLSFLVVTSAAILYCVHVYRVRKHLVHLEKLLIMVKWSSKSS